MVYQKSYFVILLICGFISLIIYTSPKFLYFSAHLTNADKRVVPDPVKGYLVSTPQCNILDYDPYSYEVMKYFKKLPYVRCTKKHPLTYISKDNNVATLHINRSVIRQYTKKDIDCCYAYIFRETNDENPDKNIRLSKCVSFKSSTKLSGNSFVTVKCKKKYFKTEIYSNTHSIITIKDTAIKINETKTNNPAPSVLFIEIDSISRLNLIRSMPKTYNYLEKHNWFSLKGYNKIGDNTFPNLVAILSGYNDSRVFKLFNPTVIGEFEKCPIIWKTFQKFGYTTAYAEDEAEINTFNFLKKGFVHPPTDYYFRPYVMASEKLKILKKFGLSYCAGPETSGERILNLAKDFAVTFKNYLSFGFFWMNTFSHNMFTAPSMLDAKVESFLKDLENRKIYENTIVIFLSDHGMRFGEMRSTFSGWLEESLPFIYIFLPKWFRENFSNETRNLKDNMNKLVTPYNLYMTLQHILVLSGFKLKVELSDGCPSCTSIFSNIASNRTCDSAHIATQWCSCIKYKPLQSNTNLTKIAAIAIIEEILSVVKSKNLTEKCAKFALKSVINAHIADKNEYQNETYLLISFETKPYAIFESTVKVYFENNQTLVLADGPISRLNQYSAHSKCTKDAHLKKYCYCFGS